MCYSADWTSGRKQKKKHLAASWHLEWKVTSQRPLPAGCSSSVIMLIIPVIPSFWIFIGGIWKASINYKLLPGTGKPHAMFSARRCSSLRTTNLQLPQRRPKGERSRRLAPIRGAAVVGCHSLPRKVSEVKQRAIPLNKSLERYSLPAGVIHHI